LNEDEVHMEAHIDFKEDIKLSEFDAILAKIEELVYHKHGINHVNIQPEFDKPAPKNTIEQDCWKQRAKHPKSCRTTNCTKFCDSEAKSLLWNRTVCIRILTIRTKRHSIFWD